MKLNRYLLIMLQTILLICVLSSQILVAETPSYVMTQEERALMPSYLEKEQSLFRSTVQPPHPVRNIAEFEPMEGVLVAYPFGVPLSLIAEISKDAGVTTIVGSSSIESRVRSEYQSAGVQLSRCTFIYAPSDSYWTRDYGPWFIADGNGKISIVDFTYNRPRPNDNRIPAAAADFLGLDLYFMNLVHCGGNYMTDSLGISVSTDLVLEENSSLAKKNIDDRMNKFLGVTQYHTTDDPLGEYIKHVDCWGKYLDVDKILITRVPSSHANYSKYEKMTQFFSEKKSSYGTPYQVFRVESKNGEPYTNSLILNDKVFVPLMGTSSDTTALSAYRTAMPGYKIMGFKGSWETTDAIHCRIKGMADRNMLSIQHQPISGFMEQADVEITAHIKAYSQHPIQENSVTLNYRIDKGTFQTADMVKQTNGSYLGIIPAPPLNTAVSYYIHAEDAGGNRANHPFIGAFDPHQFTVGVQPVSADFSADSTAISSGESIRFTDQSSPQATHWQWSFDGGTPSTSYDQNPVITYNTQGVYSVSLIAGNGSESDTETKKDFITVRETNSNTPVAEFSASATTIRAGSSIRFRDRSLNAPSSWKWTFKGGSPSESSSRNPTVTYRTPGVYDVSLTVSNADGKDTENKLEYITVLAR